ncbi:SLC13 family permease [Amphibacillus sp. MSJ-3]|uniref:SLC13 family permease n=1 Tax=Amphibacillus sp. MSJ-3 TaxID=2841505 RepID=UPI0020A19CC1|nr:SLC13 family permease [Amphibacillus sp. MSJ-3]
MLVCMILEVARPGIIIFIVLVLLLITNILTPEEALSGFSNEGMLTVALLFIVAGVVQKNGKLDEMVEALLRNSRTIPGAMVRFLIPISLLSAFLNNTPIVVTFTPIIKNWCEEHGIAPSKFLIPLSYATILGGTMTIMGTSTNLVIHGLLLSYGLEGFSFFSLAVVGIPITVLGLLYLFTIGRSLLPNHKGFSQQVKEDTKEYVAELQVEASFPHLNKSIRQAGLADLNGLYVIEIIRKHERISPVRETTIIQVGDRLIFAGELSIIAELQKTEGLELRTGTELSFTDLKNGNTYLIEAVVSHQSSFIAKSIKQSRFRSHYDAGVIAVHRNNERIQGKIGDIILKPGDSLLLLTDAKFIEKYQQSNDFYLVSRIEPPKQLSENSFKSWFPIGILIAMIIFVTIGFLTMLKAMALTVVIFILMKFIDAEDIKKNIHFDVLLIIASSFGIGIAMTKTGLADLLAGGLIAIGRPIGTMGVLIMMYILTSIFTEFITNNAAAVLMLPIGLEIAKSLDVDPIGLAVLITIAASASFITPIGYQTNLIVYGPGGYRFIDYVRVGTPLNLLVMVTTLSVVYYRWF